MGSPVGSPVRGRSPVSSPVRAQSKSPVRSPVGSPARSPVRSPVGSPVRARSKSPVRSPVRARSKSPERSTETSEDTETTENTKIVGTEEFKAIKKQEDELRKNYMLDRTNPSRLDKEDTYYDLIKVEGDGPEIYRKKFYVNANKKDREGVFTINNEYRPRGPREKDLLSSMIPDSVKQNVCIAGGAVLSYCLQAVINDIDMFIVGDCDPVQVAKRLILEIYKKTPLNGSFLDLDISADGKVTGSGVFYPNESEDEKDEEDDEDEGDDGQEPQGTVDDLCYTLAQKNLTFSRTKNALEFKHPTLPYKIQIILRHYNSVSEVLTGFDIDCAGFAYHNGNIYCTERAKYAVFNAVNTVDVSRHSPSYEYRLMKYCTRGFGIYTGFTDEELRSLTARSKETLEKKLGDPKDDEDEEEEQSKTARSQGTQEEDDEEEEEEQVPLMDLYNESHVKKKLFGFPLLLTLMKHYTANEPNLDGRRFVYSMIDRFDDDGHFTTEQNNYAISDYNTSYEYVGSNKAGDLKLSVNNLKSKAVPSEVTEFMATIYYMLPYLEGLDRHIKDLHKTEEIEETKDGETLTVEIPKYLLPVNNIIQCVDFLINLRNDKFILGDDDTVVALQEEKVQFITKNPGKQFSSSFHPSNITMSQWLEGNYLPSSSSSSSSSTSSSSSSSPVKGVPPVKSSSSSSSTPRVPSPVRPSSSSSTKGSSTPSKGASTARAASPVRSTGVKKGKFETRIWPATVGDGPQTTIYYFYQGERELTNRQVLKLIETDREFLNFMIEKLKNANMDGYFWEVKPISPANLDGYFEYALIQTDKFEDVQADRKPFIKYLNKCRRLSTMFKNLSGDATLVIPCDKDPEGPPSDKYAHLASFVRKADMEQVRDVFMRAFSIVSTMVAEGAKVYVSTHGLGVHWVHIRLEKTPKYYTYKDYAS